MTQICFAFEKKKRDLLWYLANIGACCLGKFISFFFLFLPRSWRFISFPEQSIDRGFSFQPKLIKIPSPGTTLNGKAVVEFLAVSIRSNGNTQLVYCCLHTERTIRAFFFLLLACMQLPATVGWFEVRSSYTQLILALIVPIYNCPEEISHLPLLQLHVNTLMRHSPQKGPFAYMQSLKSR